MIANEIDGNTMTVPRKAGGNWVEGDHFFDREAEIEALADRRSK